MIEFIIICIKLLNKEKIIKKIRGKYEFIKKIICFQPIKGAGKF